MDFIPSASSFWALPLCAVQKWEPLFHCSGITGCCPSSLPPFWLSSLALLQYHAWFPVAIPFAFLPFPLQRVLLVSCTFGCSVTWAFCVVNTFRNLWHPLPHFPFLSTLITSRFGLKLLFSFKKKKWLCLFFVLFRVGDICVVQIDFKLWSSYPNLSNLGITGTHYMSSILSFVFWDRTSLYNPSWPGNCCVDPASLKISCLLNSGIIGMCHHSWWLWLWFYFILNWDRDSLCIPGTGLELLKYTRLALNS